VPAGTIWRQHGIRGKLRLTSGANRLIARVIPLGGVSAMLAPIAD
jgi:hypothetical protein